MTRKATTMTITRQKLYATLRKAGYAAAKFHRSGMVRGWGEWASGVQVELDPGSCGDWRVSYSFGARRETETERIVKLQAVQKVLIDAGIDCYPNTEETHIIIGDSSV